jgi:hypothetical protein
VHVWVEIRSVVEESKGVFREEPSGGLVIVSGTVIIEAGFGVELSPGIAEIVHDAAGRGHEIPERNV